jgi:hypothetical protein
MPFFASARLSTKAPSAPLSTATDLPARSRIERMPGRPTTTSAPCETSTTSTTLGCSPSTARPEQLVEADHHAVDRLVAERAQHLARRRVLDELDRGRIEPAELAREVERLAADPDVGADAQRVVGLAHAAAEREREHRDGQQPAPHAELQGPVHAPPGTKM